MANEKKYISQWVPDDRADTIGEYLSMDEAHK